MEPITIGGIIIAITTGAKFLQDGTQIAADISENGTKIVNSVTSAYSNIKNFFVRNGKIKENTFTYLESDPSDEDIKKIVRKKIEDVLDDETARNDELVKNIAQILKALEDIPQNSEEELQRTVGLDLRESKEALVKYRNVVAEKGTTAIDARKSTGATFEGETLTTKSSEEKK